MNKLSNGKTELVFILDKSGSMTKLADDAREGFNALIEQNKALETTDEVLVTTVLFNNVMDVINNREEISDVAPLRKEDYCTCGTTALFDAVGKTIAYLDGVHKELGNSQVPSKTVVFITTDGYENASNLYDGKDIQKLIARKKNDGWKFVFLAAGIDAEEQADALGVDKRFAVRCEHTNVGMRSMSRRMTCLSKAIVMQDEVADDNELLDMLHSEDVSDQDVDDIMCAFDNDQFTF